MTLKELLNKVEFDDVAPYIVQHYPNMAKCLSGFKEAFDGMRNTMPANLDGEKVKVEYYIEDAEEPCLAVYHSDNADWETVVGREVIIGTNVSAPLEEVVAAILFDATFWGFTPEDREETFDEWQEDRRPPTNGNPYRLKWWHLTQREHDSKCRKEDIGTRTYTWVGDTPFTEKRTSREIIGVLVQVGEDDFIVRNGDILTMYSATGETLKWRHLTEEEKEQLKENDQ